MVQTDKERLFELIRLMNQYRHEYYNLNAPTVSDEVYDRLFDELVGLQTKTCIYMANSPAMAPGYPPVSKLEKVNHPPQPCIYQGTAAVSDDLLSQAY